MRDALFLLRYLTIGWLQRRDLNPRSPDYEPGEMIKLLYSAIVLVLLVGFEPTLYGI